jgi:outer membrane biosynthesis protein TonB
MFEKNKFIICVLVSSILHTAILYIALNTDKKNVYLSSPIEVVFYSNSDRLSDQSRNEFFKNSEPFEHVEEEINNDNFDKSSIVPQKTEKVLQEDIVALNKKEKTKEVKKEKKSLEKKNNKLSTKNENKKVRNLINFSSGVAGNNSNVQTHKASDTNNFAMFGSEYEDLSFEDKNFKFAYYANQIVNKIKKYWNWSSSYSELRTVVYFKIHRDGTVSDILVKKPSKNAEYDKFSIDTIVRASPFPQLPEGYKEAFLGVYFEFVSN